MKKKFFFIQSKKKKKDKVYLSESQKKEPVHLPRSSAWSCTESFRDKPQADLQGSEFDL